MKSLKKLIKIVLYTIVILTVITMSFQIWKIPDYRNGETQFVFSQDGKYKGMIVYSIKNSWQAIAILIRVDDNEILAYERLTRDSSLNPKTSWFTCYGHNDYKDDCFSPADFMNPIGLPPSLWHRVHAWLTVKIKGLENQNLEENDKTPRHWKIKK